MSVERDEAQALAKRLNWEPPGHLGMPGWIPDDAWEHWGVFAVVASRSINWRPVDPVIWRAQFGDTWTPDYQDQASGELLALERHVWHGFPDPPEWALHVVDREARTTRCLGCFDHWPESWVG